MNWRFFGQINRFQLDDLHLSRQLDLSIPGLRLVLSTLARVVRWDPHNLRDLQQAIVTCVLC